MALSPPAVYNEPETNSPKSPTSITNPRSKIEAVSFDRCELGSSDPSASESIEEKEVQPGPPGPPTLPKKHGSTLTRYLSRMSLSWPC